MKYQGLSGTVYEVEEKRIAGGGEGNVYALTGNANQVAKIFREGKRDTWREEKLRLMMQEKLSEEQVRQITWPQDVIYDQNGFAGYIMPKLVNSSSLTELYTEEEYDLRFRLLAAANLCAAIDTVHQMGQVCGDLNPQNIFVNLDKNDRQNSCKVTLVDTDSYHFTAKGNTYRCEVGLGEFIAPELQKKMSGGCDLKNVPLPSYTRETDLFALAVHIFCLLMNGCHPFACATDMRPGESNISQMTAGTKKDSIVCPQPVENIKNGFLPFYDKRDGIVTPVYAPEFESLPDELRAMFIRTFVDGYRDPSRRVTAAEWYQVLKRLRGRIRQCSKVVSDYYFDHVWECPLCKVREKLDGVGTGPVIPPKPPKPPVPPDPPKPSTPPQINPPKSGRKEVLMCLIIYALTFLVVFFIAKAVTHLSKRDVFDNYKEEYNEEGYEEDYKDDQYRQLVSQASAAIDNGAFDQAIAYCDEACTLATSDGVSKKQAYYWKGKALLEKGDLQQSLAVLQAGQGESYDAEIETAYGELINEVQKRKEAAEEQARKEEKKLKRLNKIISAIKDKRYKRAGTLASTYCYEHEFGKIYVQGGKIVKTIKKGKGFLINEDAGLAYYGSFKNGKRNGKGIETGQDIWGDNFKIQGTYKDNKLNGKASVYQWNQKLGKKTYQTKIVGTYKNNKENGRMKITYYYQSGNVMNTYFINSSNGNRRVILYDPEVGYVFAQTSNGDNWIGQSKKKSLSGCGHPAYYAI